MVEGIHIEAKVLYQPAVEAFNTGGRKPRSFYNEVAQGLLGRGNEVGVVALGLLPYAKGEIVLRARVVGKAPNRRVETAAMLDGHRLGFIHPLGNQPIMPQSCMHADI